MTTRDIARVLMHDPMFTVRVLRYLQVHRNAAQQTDITTVEQALLMLGISAFFKNFSDLPVVELTMADQPDALYGLLRVICRAHHAALFARDWAELRRHARTDEITISALLHDLADKSLASHPHELTVVLAVRLARHSANGWENPALPADYAAIGNLLKLPQVEVLARIRRVALKAQAASDWYHLEIAPVPVHLELPAGDVAVFP